MNLQNQKYYHFLWQLPESDQYWCLFFKKTKSGYKQTWAAPKLGRRKLDTEIEIHTNDFIINLDFRPNALTYSNINVEDLGIIRDLSLKFGRREFFEFYEKIYIAVKKCI